jgi:hypothetical protein
LPHARAADKFGTGFVAESDAVYDAFPKVARYRAFLPASVDLSGRFPKAGYQGQQGSCTAWATAYAVRSYYGRGTQVWQNYAPEDQVFSPAFVYNHLHSDAQCSKGTSISAALDFIRDAGVPPMSSFPYQLDSCTLQPGGDVQDIASRFKIRSWRSLAADRLDDVKGQLASGNPVIFGMNITDEFLTLGRAQIYDDSTSAKTDGHAMVIVGYDEEKQAFKVFNSWGTGWGDEGYGWISYSAMKARAQRYFIVEVPEEASYAQPIPLPAPQVVVVVTPSPPPIASVSVTQTLPVADLPRPVPAPLKLSEPPAPPLVKDVSPKPVLVKGTFSDFNIAVQQQLATVPCSRLQARIATDRSVLVSGFAGTKEDVDKLSSQLHSLPEAGRIDVGKVSYSPWPRCEAMLSFQQPLASAQGLAVKLVGDHGGVYKAGDALSIEVTTPAFASYLYVTYLTASGEAVHLEWSPGIMSKPIAPNSKIRLGDKAKGLTFKIGPPFGEEMIIAVASASPLFLGTVPERAIDREYLSTFRAAFLVKPKGADKNRVVSAAMIPLKTMAE